MASNKVNKYIDEADTLEHIEPIKKRPKIVGSFIRQLEFEYEQKTKSQKTH